ARRYARHFLAGRLPKYLDYFERVLARNGGRWMVGAALTYVDLSMFQVVAGLRYAFPRAMARLAPGIPLLMALHRRVASRPGTATISVDGGDIVADYRAARSLIGLVPQELTTDAFESVWNTVSFSRGLFGKPADPAHIEKVLKELSLWDKKDSKVMTLSGGMKRRLLIAKALSHEPSILFLDEPTAGVDVELRRDMWKLVRSLQAAGVTIILTTHYIDEAEEMADRIGVINKGEIILVEDKALLMRKLGKKQLTLQLEHALERVPPQLSAYNLELANHGSELIYTYDALGERTSIAA